MALRPLDRRCGPSVHFRRLFATPLRLGAFGLPLILSLSACLEKDKDAPALGTSAFLPAWDTSLYRPQALETVSAGDENPVFGLFREIEIADSLAKASAPSPRPHPVDTVRWHHIVDTAFHWPAQPQSLQPYAYDGQFRMDTLFRKAYGLGLFEQEHPCLQTWVLAKPFHHPTYWLKAGMRQEDLLAALGHPRLLTPTVMSFFGRNTQDTLGTESGSSYEGIKFFFKNDSLFAAMLQRPKPCF